MNDDDDRGNGDDKDYEYFGMDKMGRKDNYGFGIGEEFNGISNRQGGHD